MRVVPFFQIFFIILLFLQNLQQITATTPNGKGVDLLLRNDIEKTPFFKQKLLEFITESSSLLCIECFKRDFTKMLTCLSQPPLPDRVDFIRQQFPIPADIYAKIISKYISW